MSKSIKFTIEGRKEEGRCVSVGRSVCHLETENREAIIFANPPKLSHRSCMCEQGRATTDSRRHDPAGSHLDSGKCSNEFETSYAPERPEIVYCEKCYQQDVY